MVTETQVYLGLAVTGFFTGLGVVTAQTIFELFIKPKVKKIHKEAKKIHKTIQTHIIRK